MRRDALETSSGRFESLRALNFFSSLDEIELWEIVDSSVFLPVIRGDELLTEGEDGDDFLVILEGRVEITKKGKKIDEIVEDSTIGEVSYVLKGVVTRNATATSLDEGLVIRISHAAMLNLSISCRGKIEQQFLKLLALRLIDVNRKLSVV